MRRFRNLRALLTGSWAVITVIVVLASAASSAKANPITSNTWYEFAFTTAGTPVTACTSCEASTGTPSVYAGNPPYTFTLTSAGDFTVQDAFLRGDVFEVFDFGVLIGTTDFETIDTTHNCGSDPVVCSMDPLMSQGTFLLSSGAHSISLTPTQVVPGGGAAYFDLTTSAVSPEPSSFILLGTGLLGAAGVIRRRLA